MSVVVCTLELLSAFAQLVVQRLQLVIAWNGPHTPRLAWLTDRADAVGRGETGSGSASRSALTWKGWTRSVVAALSARSMAPAPAIPTPVARRCRCRLRHQARGRDPSTVRPLTRRFDRAAAGPLEDVGLGAPGSGGVAEGPGGVAPAWRLHLEG